ncbi:MAG: hypothetical protein U9R26_05435 [Campylobacterota bacterium]|nr:hypothetical protein [Campylobacterota bacterium]
MFHYKIVFLFLLMFASLELQGKTAGSFRAFDIESAFVTYDINGSGELSADSQLEISGKSTLVFTEWGARKLYKEKYVEATTGTVKNTKTIRTLYREDRGIVYRADFEKEKIETSEDPVLRMAVTTGKNLYKKSIEDMLAKGKKTGSSTVMGYHCDEWLYKGKKRCYHKGVPLKEETMVSGIQVLKTAVFIEFDQNISEDVFALPDFLYDEQKGFLMKEKAVAVVKKEPIIDKAADKNASDEIEEVIKIDDMEIEDAEIDDDAEIERDADLTENMFQQQKELLPKLLTEMQEARVCMENANNKDEANLCLSKLIDIEEKMSGEKSKEGKITVWTDVSKEQTMDELEEGILDMKRRMPCIRRSQNFDDLSKCMRDSQED